MKNLTDFFILHTHVKITKGFSRSLIIDLHHRCSFFVPNSLFEFVEMYEKKFSVSSILNLYSDDPKDLNIIKKYFDFLNQNDLIYFGDETEIEMFNVQMSKFESPFNYTDSIIERTETSHSIITIKDILTRLDEQFIKHIEIRYLDKKSILYDCDELTTFIPNSCFETVTILTPKNNTVLSYFSNLDIPKISDLIFYGDFTNLSSNELKIQNSKNAIKFLNQSSIHPSECGNITSENFIYNISFFQEAQEFNTCLNKKISVDPIGELKNCPSCNNSHGTIDSKKLREMHLKKEFNYLWTITKDQVEVCKDCEFRNVCSDCRAILVEPDNIYSKPEKCNYDPYSSTWR